MVVGQGGMYLAVDDLWLEHASGNFFLSLLPSKYVQHL